MKTKNKAYDAVAYNFSEGESILVDANVWLYLQPPAAQPTPRWAISYSGVFCRILSAKAQPLVDSHVLSEYLNRYVRLEYDARWKTSYPKFKDFRQSVDGFNILKAAISEISQILKSSAAMNTPLANMDLPGILSAVQNGTVDFNDALLIQNCRLNGWKLLTNDLDMSLGGIEVLTTNKKLLGACP